MKIYFAGAIRGGGGDEELYSELINYLKKFGEVLTIHVGSNDLIDSRESTHSNEEIFER